MSCLRLFPQCGRNVYNAHSLRRCFMLCFMRMLPSDPGEQITSGFDCVITDILHTHTQLIRPQEFISKTRHLFSYYLFNIITRRSNTNTEKQLILNTPNGEVTACLFFTIISGLLSSVKKEVMSHQISCFHLQFVQISTLN